MFIIYSLNGTQFGWRIICLNPVTETWYIYIIIYIYIYIYYVYKYNIYIDRCGKKLDGYNVINLLGLDSELYTTYIGKWMDISRLDWLVKTDVIKMH